MRRVITISTVALLAAGTLAGCAADPPKRTGSAGTVTETVTNPNPPGSPGPYQPASPTPYPPGTVIGPAPSGAVVTAPGTGGLVDRNQRWRGAPVGGAGGAVGGTVSEMRSRASREAAAGNRPVAYQTEDGSQRVEAYPQPTTSPRGCRQVQERVFQNGQLLQDSVREVCS